MAGEVEKGAKIARMERALDNPVQSLKQIGALMVAESQAAFRDQRLGDAGWAPRRVPNVMAIIADFYAGKPAPPARRFEERPALRDTGRLAASIASRVVSTDSVEVGTNLPYASALHYGGEVESQPINEKVRTALWSWLKGPGKQWKKRLGWLLNKKFKGQTLKTKVPARPIVGLTKQTLADIREVVGVSILEAN